MRRWGHRRHTSTRHCGGGVLAVGALLESAPVLNFHGLELYWKKNPEIFPFFNASRTRNWFCPTAGMSFHK